MMTFERKTYLYNVCVNSKNMTESEYKAFVRNISTEELMFVMEMEKLLRRKAIETIKEILK